MKGIRIGISAVIAAVVGLLLSGCGGETESGAGTGESQPTNPGGGGSAISCTGGIAPTIGSSGFTVRRFAASYYSDATFVASECVQRPSINYTYSDFYGINSNNFRAIWSGRLEVPSGPQTVNMNFDVSWSDVTLSVDGVQVSAWSNSLRTISHQFTTGIHDIVVEYHNNWHGAGFNVSFTNHATYSKADAQALIAPLIDSSTQIIYVGDYESGERYNNTTITLQRTASRVFLFLSSYAAQNWIIENPNGVTIAGIAYGSYAPGSTVTYGVSTPGFAIAGLAYGYSNFSGPTADIQYLTGRVPDYTYGAYNLTTATISIP